MSFLDKIFGSRQPKSIDEMTCRDFPGEFIKAFEANDSERLIKIYSKWNANCDNDANLLYAIVLIGHLLDISSDSINKTYRLAEIASIANMTDKHTAWFRKMATIVVAKSS